jgi:hypothetical protein
MSVSDLNVVRAFERLREFCNDIAVLLRTADSEMRKGGFVSESKGFVFDGLSAAIDQPDFWLPNYFQRFYLHPARRSILAFISVIVGSPKWPDRVREAIITGGWFDYGTEVPGKSWLWTYAQAHIWAEPRKDDGTLCFGDMQGNWKDDANIHHVQKIASFAYPLSTIVDGSRLKTKMVDRLTSEILAAKTT